MCRTPPSFFILQSLILRSLVRLRQEPLWSGALHFLTLYLVLARFVKCFWHVQKRGNKAALFGRCVAACEAPKRAASRKGRETLPAFLMKLLALLRLLGRVLEGCRGDRPPEIRAAAA